MTISAFDKIDLSEAVVRMYAALDDHVPEGFAAAFTKDGTFTSRYGAFKGRKEIEEFIRHHIASGAEDGARHILSNFLFKEEPEGAVARSYLIKLRHDETRVWIAGTSKTTSHLVRDGSKWLIRLFELETALKVPQGPPK